MGRPSAKELSNELNRLMLEQVESLSKEAFIGLNGPELRRQEERLKRIREISADFLEALKSSDPQDDVKSRAPKTRKDDNP